MEEHYEAVISLHKRIHDVRGALNELCDQK